MSCAGRPLSTSTIKVGNLEASRDFLDVRDVVKAYADIALQPAIKPRKRAYNISSGKARKIGDILTSLLEMSRVPIDVAQDPDRMRPSEVPYACGDNTAMREDFGWEPTIEFRQTLEDTLAGFRKMYG